MTREEAIQELRNCKGLIQQDGQDYLDERDIPLLDIAIEALSVAELKPKFESAVPNCKKCAIKQLWKETEKEDLVAVVRCKECKWFKKIVEKSKSGLCHYDLVARCLHDEDYCSHGERKE